MASASTPVRPVSGTAMEAGSGGGPHAGGHGSEAQRSFPASRRPFRESVGGTLPFRSRCWALFDHDHALAGGGP